MANRASSLCGIYHWVEGHTAILAAALSDIEHAVKLSQNEPVFQSSYKKTLADLRKHVSSLSVSPQTSLRRDVRWIWESRLALNPCPLCRQESPEAFDLFPLAARLEGVHRKPEVDVVLDLVNSLCRNYATARWVLYKAVADPPLESDHVITNRREPVRTSRASGRATHVSCLRFLRIARPDRVRTEQLLPARPRCSGRDV